MKRNLVSLTALAALTLTGLASAQDNDNPRGRGGMRHDPMERAIEQLDLTPEQKTKVQPILEEAKPKLAEIRREAMQKSKSVMDETFAKIKPLLTPEQQTKLEQAKDNRRGDRGDRGGRHGRRGGGTATEDDNG